jgi:hypothetical protein
MDCDDAALGAICAGFTRGDWIAIGCATFFLILVGLGLLWLVHDIMGHSDKPSAGDRK